MIPLAKFLHLPPSIFERSENPAPSVLGLWLIFIFISALAPSRGQANPPVLVAEDGTFLGVASANPYDPDSTSNPFGQYGSQFSATSINNPYSLYGSEYSAESATNPYLVSEPEEK
jgi:hypothetical protein